MTRCALDRAHRGTTGIREGGPLFKNIPDCEWRGSHHSRARPKVPMWPVEGSTSTQALMMPNLGVSTTRPVGLALHLMAWSSFRIIFVSPINSAPQSGRGICLASTWSSFVTADSCQSTLYDLCSWQLHQPGTSTTCLTSSTRLRRWRARYSICSGMQSRSNSAGETWGRARLSRPCDDPRTHGSPLRDRSGVNTTSSRAKITLKGGGVRTLRPSLSLWETLRSSCIAGPSFSFRQHRLSTSLELDLLLSFGLLSSKLIGVDFRLVLSLLLGFSSRLCVLGLLGLCLVGGPRE